MDTARDATTIDAPAQAPPVTRARAALRLDDGRLTTAGRVAVAVVAVAVFLTALDQTVVVTALISMLQDIGLNITQPDRAAWIISGYLLGYVIAMPLMGRVADIYGRWRVFAICLAIFGVGSALCALSPVLGGDIAPDFTTLGGAILTPFYNGTQGLLGLLGHVGVDTTYPALDVLVGARFLQALGGGALVPVAMAVVGDLFGSNRRGLALGLIGAITEAGGVLGPVWGAWITSTWGWQWIFTLNVPFAVILFVAGFFTLPRGRGARERVDLPGALLFGASLACLTIGLGQQTGESGTFSLNAHVNINPVLLGAAAVLFAGFVALELKVRWPVVEPALFRRAAFTGAALLSLLIGMTLIVALVMIPLFIGTLVVTSPSDGAIQSGLALLRMTALVPVGAIAGGWFSTRFGCRISAVVGVLCASAGFWLMHLWPATVGWAQITSATVVAGLGFGLVIAPISTSALNAARASQAGVASSVVTALRMAGMILGLAIVTAWGLARLRVLVAPYLKAGASPSAAVLTGALHELYIEVFAVTALVTLLGILPALLLWRRRADEGETSYESFVAPLA